MTIPILLALTESICNWLRNQLKIELVNYRMILCMALYSPMDPIKQGGSNLTNYSKIISKAPIYGAQNLTELIKVRNI